MDDEQTRADDEASGDRAPGGTPGSAVEPVAPPPPGTTPPPPPGWSASASEPPPPPTVGWTLPPGGPQGVAARPALNVSRIVGRTFDTLGREWSLFLALAIPAGLGGIASAMFTQSMQAILRDPAAAAADQAPTILAQLGIAVLSGITTLATIIATDRLWRGRAVGLGEALRGGVALVPRALGLLLLALALILAFSFLLVLSLMLIGILGPAGALVGILGVIVLVVIALWVSARLAVLLPVLAFEDAPVLGVIGRTWRLTKGHALVLFVTALVISLCGLLPSWGGTLFSMFVDDRLIAGIALGLATMVTAPLAGIWTVLAWGELTGNPHHDSEVMTTGRGRVAGFLLVGGVGVVLILVGGALAAGGSAEFNRLYEGI